MRLSDLPNPPLSAQDTRIGPIVEPFEKLVNTNSAKVPALRAAHELEARPVQWEMVLSESEEIVWCRLDIASEHRLYQALTDP